MIGMRFILQIFVLKGPKEKGVNGSATKHKMFSFHKPKVYRSTTGCCICKAKSSSSRFTDSKKYEDDFVECFNLKERRSGEICNACVLLVKRWKKLPKGTDRNWHHVVDARAGPGTKSLTKFKSKKLKKNPLNPDKPVKEKIKKKHRYVRKVGREGSPGALSDDVTVGDERLSEGSGPSVPGSLAPSPYPSPYPSEDDADSQDRTLLTGAAKRKKQNPSQFQLSSFVDLSYWKQEKVCCGLIFRGDCGEVLIDPRFFQPCSCRIKSLESSPAPTPASTPLASSGASDGGSHYDDEILEMMSEANMNEDDDYQDSDSLDERLDEPYYSSATNSPSAPLLPHLSAGLAS
ncbi:SIN3-HDAC complex-associated factor-like isoform X1 [Penaeus chinensis]|uniref:SIN3-HDAC complex-associated factor-like isoform X1 n=1 Tax=Penaeus chinensis TaxID=139456 RepID=UPI001FB60083|nr:SIN3-HDAC complex-associated factor-like isoform X1 [Penaeus chinensis]